MGVLFETRPDQDGTRLSSAVGGLLQRPFVERVNGGFRIAEPMAARLRSWFRESDEEWFRQVNESFMRIERAQFEASDDDEDRWFTRGRISFYLAAVDPRESADSFIRAFAEPPRGDPGPPRSWLAALALRQRDQLAGQGRAINFFEGFQAYKRGDWATARERLDAVLGTGEPDEFRAIALHLSSNVPPRPEDSEDYLTEAVSLSQQLGLAENEGMSRNTLIYRLIARGATADETDSGAILANASALATINLSRARQTNDPHLIVWCDGAAAESLWLTRTDLRRHVDKVRPREIETVLTLLDRAIDGAERLGDLGSAVYATSVRASVLWDLGQYGAAVDSLAMPLARWLDVEPPGSVRKLRVVLRAMTSSDLDGTSMARLSQIRFQVANWLRADDPQFVPFVISLSTQGENELSGDDAEDPTR